MKAVIIGKYIKKKLKKDIKHRTRTATLTFSAIALSMCAIRNNLKKYLDLNGKQITEHKKFQNRFGLDFTISAFMYFL
jgi:hypothetical protein